MIQATDFGNSFIRHFSAFVSRLQHIHFFGGKKVTIPLSLKVLPVCHCLGQLTCTITRGLHALRTSWNTIDFFFKP